MLRILLVAVATLAALAGLTWVAQRSLLFPRRSAPAFDPSRAAGLEPLGIENADAVDAWFLPPKASAGPAPALLFAHGNGELIDDWLAVFREPTLWGVGVLLVEYPGYGRSPGSPSEASITRSLVGAYDALSRRPEVDPAAIVGYGRSLGGAAICQLAARRELAAMILESTFTGVRPLARRMGVPGFLVRDPFDALPVLRSFERPLLLVHGIRDAIVPFDHAEAIRELVPHARLEPLPCGHNDCPRPWREIETFLRETGLLAGG